MEDSTSIRPWLRRHFGEAARTCRGEEEEEEEERSELVGASARGLTPLLPYLSKPKWLQQEKWDGIVQENTGDCNVYSSAEYRIGSF